MKPSGGSEGDTARSRGRDKGQGDRGIGERDKGIGNDDE